MCDIESCQRNISEIFSITFILQEFVKSFQKCEKKLKKFMFNLKNE